MKSVKVRILNRSGLHARPAVRFTQFCSRFRSSIKVCKDNNCADSKNLLKILSLGVDYGDIVTLIIDGEDEDEAHSALLHFIEKVLPVEDGEGI
ncbi:MAG: HPr family phosphocarrier protein [Desulfurococcales archaeon]|jgi:phosphocarrier protein|nr:HPr family phosphocarrier protein [Desulfurococcales archaeon]